MRETKRIARADHTIIGVEVVVEPIEVQVPALAIPVQVRDVALAITVTPVMCKVSSQPPSFDYSWDCIEFGIVSPNTLHRVSSFLIDCEMTLAQDISCATPHTGIPEFGHLQP